jgi:hypothetical protein
LTKKPFAVSRCPLTDTFPAFSSPDGGFTTAFAFSGGLPEITREPLNSAFGSVKVGQAPRLAPDFFQQNQINGYAQQWNLSIQRAFGKSWLVDVAYVGTKGTHLIASTDPNQPVPGATAIANTAARR